MTRLVRHACFLVVFAISGCGYPSFGFDDDASAQDSGSSGADTNAGDGVAVDSHAGDSNAGDSNTGDSNTGDSFASDGKDVAPPIDSTTDLGSGGDVPTETPIDTGPICHSDADCDDHDACNGKETCNVGTGACRPGTPVTCTAPTPCDVASCDKTSGACSHTRVDVDGDGYAPIKLGSCGLDCNDKNASVHPGAGYMTASYLTEDGIAQSWDYDCDGFVSEEWGGGSCGGGGPCPAPPCTYTAGFVAPSGIAFCGNSGNWLDGCTLTGTCCSFSSTSTRVQACR